jgi:hypothetical protein
MRKDETAPQAGFPHSGTMPVDSAPPAVAKRTASLDRRAGQA